MKHFSVGAVLFGTLSLGACATTVSDEKADKAAERLAEFEATGERTSCLSLRRITSITPLDDKTFLVRAGNDYYVNKVSGRCAGADSNFNRLQYRLNVAQLCRNEIVTVVDNTQGFTVGSCGLNDFERLEKKEPPSDDAS